MDRKLIIEKEMNYNPGNSSGKKSADQSGNMVNNKLQNKLQNKLHNKQGQALVVAVLALAVLLGSAALAVDLGRAYVSRQKMQNAADLAAEAGALYLTGNGSFNAINAAVSSAEANGVEASRVTVNTPYKGDDSLIEVICEKTINYGFARTLGEDKKNVSGRAVARGDVFWAGEAFPFINLDDDYAVDSSIVVWEKKGNGDFESLWKTEYTAFNLGKNDDHSQGYFSVDYSDGLTITKGVVATIKQEIGYIYEQHRPGYVFSLSTDAISSGKYNNLKNKDVIPVEDLVLLQVTFDSYKSSDKQLYLTVTGVYDFNNGVTPTEYLYDRSNMTSSLVE